MPATSTQPGVMRGGSESGKGAPSMGVSRTALLTFCDSGKRVAKILMIAWPELDFAARCATTKHTVSASLHMHPQAHTTCLLAEYPFIPPRIWTCTSAPLTEATQECRRGDTRQTRLTICHKELDPGSYTALCLATLPWTYSCA